MHRWFSNVFEIYWDVPTDEIQRIRSFLMADLFVPFPHSKTLIVRCRDNTTISVDERDRIDGTQMAIILLHNVTTANVELERGTHGKIKG
jgi:hypothetical protein